jgi:hypothetical protein
MTKYTFNTYTQEREASTAIAVYKDKRECEFIPGVAKRCVDFKCVGSSISPRDEGNIYGGCG